MGRGRKRAADISAREAGRGSKKAKSKNRGSPYDAAPKQVQVESLGEALPFQNCQPCETGVGFVSEPFSVASFKTACAAALQKLSDQCAQVAPAQNTDIEWLRLPTLAEELATAEAAAATSAMAEDLPEPAVAVDSGMTNLAPNDQVKVSSTAHQHEEATGSLALDQEPSETVMPKSGTDVAKPDESPAIASSPAATEPFSTVHAANQSAGQPADNPPPVPKPSKDLQETAVTADSGAPNDLGPPNDQIKVSTAADQHEEATGSPALDQEPSDKVVPDLGTDVPEPNEHPATSLPTAASTIGSAVQSADQSVDQSIDQSVDQPPPALKSSRERKSRVRALLLPQLSAKGANKIKQWKQMQEDTEAGVRRAADVQKRRADRLAQAQQVLECLRPDPTITAHRRNINYLPGSAAAPGTADDSTALFDDRAAPVAATSPAVIGSHSRTAPDRVPAGEVVLTVAVSHPASAQRLSQVWQVLGSNTLADLRDRIYCRSDCDLKNTGLSVPSGSMYVEGTFYNDTRDSNAIDYSFPIRSFCHEHHISAPRRPSRVGQAVPGSSLADESCTSTGAPSRVRFRDEAGAGSNQAPTQSPHTRADDASASHQAGEQTQPTAYECSEMATTTFDRLWLRLGFGAGYVYLHQGCCEHLLSFTDVRVLHPDDRQLLLQYPALNFQARLRQRVCRLCDASPASKVTYDDAHAPENPCFWCDKCFADMHYDKNKRLVVDENFKVFNYLHD